MSMTHSFLKNPGTSSEPLVRNMVRTRIPTRHGEFMLYYYENKRENKEHLALVKGDVEGALDVPVRVHSECLTGDVFGSMRCDCGDQLDRALRVIGSSECGVLLYLRQEGRGIGLLKKLQAYNLQDQGLDTVEANLRLGHREDERDYGIAAAILKDLKLHSVRLITNNPRKIGELRELGVEVTERIPIEIPFNAENEGYLRTKARKMQHLLSLTLNEGVFAEFVFIDPLLERLEAHRHGAVQRPFVTLSYAQSLDGSIAIDASGACPLRSERAVRLTRFLRSQHDAVVVGIHTILADDPIFDVGDFEGGAPQPVIFDEFLRFPLEAKVLSSGANKPIILASEGAPQARITELSERGAKVIGFSRNADGMVDLAPVLNLLLEMGLKSIMVEGDGCVINQCLRERLVDYCVIAVTPKLIGGVKAVNELCQPAESPLLHIASCHYHTLDNDIIVHGALDYS
ncbi:MAG: riboflavin-specific deaminase/GTP cyclohydrolase [Proteobacteria bacterium]|nr:riboflavin-specific deaminase/GTP cyclohydrolase [Pseudomonadota bacterium]